VSIGPSSGHHDLTRRQLLVRAGFGGLTLACIAIGRYRYGFGPSRSGDVTAIAGTPQRRVAFLADPPSFDPSWNDGGWVQWNNNCYNYACDQRTDSFAQPGKASGAPFTEAPFAILDCPAVSAAAQSDGLEPLANEYGPVDCVHIVALVITPTHLRISGKLKADFHWYRQDNDGNWSHKPGGTPATNLDNSGKPISNPETADRGPYTIFCGYFCCDGAVIG